MEDSHFRAAGPRGLLTSPSGESTLAVAPGETRAGTFENGNEWFITSERFSELNGDARIYVEVSPGSAGRVADGAWLVELLADEAAMGASMFGSNVMPGTGPTSSPTSPSSWGRFRSGHDACDASYNSALRCGRELQSPHDVS